MLAHSAKMFDVEHVSRQPSQSTEEAIELEMQQVQKPKEPSKKGYGESFILMTGWFILWLIKKCYCVIDHIVVV